MTDAPKILHNTRERLTSTDLNGNNDRAAWLVQESLQSSQSPDQLRSGVISGFNVTVDASARTATVSAGLGLFVDTTQSFPNSKSRWMEAMTSISVALPGATGFNVWLAIEIAPGTQTVSTVVVDVWDPTIPPSGGFTPMSLPKDIRSLPVVSVRTGVSGGANAPPLLDGTAGVIPLAYVFMDAAGVLYDGIDGIVSCRPMLRNPSAFDVEPFYARTTLSQRATGWVRGGGLSANNSSPTASVERGVVGAFANSALGFKVDGHSVPCSTTFSYESGGISAVDTNLYVYAIPPPYAAGYDTILADREMVVGSSVANQFVMASTGTTNCAVVLTNLPPNSVAGTTGSGNGTAVLNDPVFKTALTGSGFAESPRERWIYLGACDWDQGNNQFQGQNYSGEGLVVPRQRYPYIDFKALNNGTYDITIPNGTPGLPFDGHMPNFANQFFGIFEGDVLAGAVPPGESEVSIVIADQETVATTIKKKLDEYNFQGATRKFQKPARLVTQIGASGDVTFTITPDPTTLPSMRWITTSYYDPFLAAR